MVAKCSRDGLVIFCSVDNVCIYTYCVCVCCMQEMDGACGSMTRHAASMDHSTSHLHNSGSRESGTITRSLTVSRGASAAYMSTHTDTMSCAGRCLCSCHCVSTPVTVSDSLPPLPSPSSPNKLHGFIGTLKKKFSQIMKRDLPLSDERTDVVRPSHRTRSSDAGCSSRSASRSRTLPRNISTTTASGPSTPVGHIDCTFDTFEHRRSRSLRRQRTKVQDTTSPVSAAGGALSPSHFRRVVARPPRNEMVAGLQDEAMPRRNESLKHHGDSPKKSAGDVSTFSVDTGYGHTSAPVADGDGDAATVPSGPMAPFYDQVKESSAATTGWCLTRELFKLPKYGWYWGPITRAEAEERLAGQPDGAFLLRDSSDDRYLLSLSFRSDGRTLHTRIEHCNGLFSFYAQPESEGYSSIVDLIERSMSDSQSGVFCYSRARTPGSPSFPVRLARPISRFTQVRSLQYLCRFVIRQHTRVDYIQKLPLPTSIKGWLEETQY